jgi:hypothetical protein
VGDERLTGHAESPEVAHLALDLAGDCAPSAFFGSQQVDFNQWAWFFTVLRTLVIATASIAAYRIIFVGGGQTT